MEVESEDCGCKYYVSYFHNLAYVNIYIDATFS